MLPSILKGIIKDLNSGMTISQVVRSRRCTTKEIIEVADKHLGIKIKSPYEGRKKGGWPVKITDKQVTSMKKDKAGGMSYKEIAFKYKCSVSHANMIIGGRRRKDVPNA
jgi:Mor family transcriptional regulator